MARSDSLEMLIDLARDRVDTAGRKLGLLNSRKLDNEQKLELLLAYRSDYQARLQQCASGGMDIMAWRNFQAFMHKLDAAIAEQRVALQNAQHTAEAGRTEWMAEQRRLKSFDTLSVRQQRKVQHREAKREQRDQDEFAMAAYRKRAASGDDA
jgi:flagellar FliJ protein